MVRKDYEVPEVALEAQYSNGIYYVDIPAANYVYLTVSNGLESRTAILTEKLEINGTGYGWLQ